MKTQQNAEETTSKVGIVINRMFTGNYLVDNIGHEIINLFKADDGENYIYLCKDGKYNRKNLPQYVIQVRHHATRVLEVISIAEIESKVPENKIARIEYGGKSITKIFKDNKDEQIEASFVTFKAKRVLKPVSFQYIGYMGNRIKSDTPFVRNLTLAMILDEKTEGKEKYCFDVSETLRNYIDYNEREDSDYYKLSKFVDGAFKDDGKNWVEVKEQIVPKQNNTFTAGDIYGINNLELPYSNAFKFFLDKYPQLLSGFCKYLEEKCNCVVGDLCKYFDEHPNYKIKVYRERNNIDILIEVDESWVIVVENKIFSDLNGKKEKEITQLDNYREIVECSKKYKERGKIFVLLLPDHNNIDISNYKDWHKVFYSSVSNYLKTLDNFINDAQLKDFANMVEQHSVKDYNYGVMKRRFEQAIAKVE